MYVCTYQHIEKAIEKGNKIYHLVYYIILIMIIYKDSNEQNIVFKKTINRDFLSMYFGLWYIIYKFYFAELHQATASFLRAFCFEKWLDYELEFLTTELM